MGWNRNPLPNIYFLVYAKWLHSTKIWRTVRIHWQCSHWGGRSLFAIYQWIECVYEREMFYLTTHSTHFIYGYMASDIWLRTILIVRKETRCRHIDYSYRLTARVLLYAPSHRQDNTYHGLCYTSCGALAGTRNSSISMGPPHEGSNRRPAPRTIQRQFHPSCTTCMRSGNLPWLAWYNELVRNYNVPIIFISGKNVLADILFKINIGYTQSKSWADLTTETAFFLLPLMSNNTE